MADGDVDDWYNEAGLHCRVTPGGAAALATQPGIPLRLRYHQLKYPSPSAICILGRGGPAETFYTYPGETRVIRVKWAKKWERICDKPVDPDD